MTRSESGFVLHLRRCAPPGDATEASMVHSARAGEVRRFNLLPAKMYQICEVEMGAGKSKLEPQLAKAHAELHHYTGEGGLKGIVESNSFHASYFADMNGGPSHRYRCLQVSSAIARSSA